MSDPNPSTIPLIPENSRRACFWQLTLLTAFAWIVGGLIAALLQYQLPVSLASPVFREFLYGTIRGLLMGTSQWWVLRRHRLDSLWIFNTTGGFVISSLVAQAWRSGIGGFFSAIAYIWLGLAQWLVLRKRVQKAGYWIVVPPLAMLAANLFRLVMFVLLLGTQLSLPPLGWVGIEIIAGLIMGAVFAGSLLRFQRPSSSLSLPLEMGVQWIANRTQIRTLQANLYRQLNEAWQTETTANQALVYGVAVTSQGEIVQDRPIDAVATEYREQTPLPQLVSQNPSAHSEVAWFEVRFMPTGKLDVQPWEMEI